MSNTDEHFSDEELGAMLRSIDHPVPAIDARDVILRARRRSPWRGALLAASAVLAVSTVAAATVHTGLVARLLGGLHRTSDTRHVSHASPPATTSVSASRGISFVPGVQVDVEFRAAQPAGALQVRWSEGGSVLLTQTGAEGEAHYSLTPTGVIVDNVRSVASYTLVLPRSISRARVHVAEREVLAKNGDTVSCRGARDANDACTIALAGEVKR